MRRATQFQPKHPGRPTVRRRPPAAAAKKPSQLLKDMRWVYEYDESEDRTYGHWRCRQWLEADLKGFLTMLGRLEAALGAGRPAGR